MKKSQRIIIIALMVALLLTQSVFAIPGNTRAPGQLKKIYQETISSSHNFNDMTGYDWAQKSVQNMSAMGVLKGEGHNNFSPARAAKEIELLVMTIRFMDLEEDLVDNQPVSSRYSGKTLDPWMIPYVNLAIQEGLLTDDELSNYQPQSPATRSKAAVYIVRALDRVDEALKLQDHLPDFQDANAIPKEHLGYVNYVYSEGIMVGDRIVFQPNKPLSRAEMAVLFDRLFERTETRLRYSRTGTLVDFDESSVSIKIGNVTRSYELASNPLIYWEDIRINMDQLELDDIVKVYVLDGQVYRIDLIEESESSPVMTRRIATLTSTIQNSSGKTVSVGVKYSNSATESAIQITEDVLVEIDGKSGSILPEHEGLKLDVYASNQVIVKLDIQLDQAQGLLDAFILDSDTSVVGLSMNNTDYLFYPTAKLYINDTLTTISSLDFDLEEEFDYHLALKLLGTGDIIECRLSYDLPNTLEGTLIEYYTTSGNKLVGLDLEVNSVTDYYTVDDDVAILLDHTIVDLSEISTGTTIRVTLDDDNHVISIEIMFQE